jgi:KaiC/GvpD/RAD55 family RecA-like ATPase
METSREELEYRWLDAARTYEQKLDSMSVAASSAAEYLQRTGFCYSLASRQAEDANEFKRLTQLAGEAYGQAARLYEQDKSLANNAEYWKCYAIAEYNRSWLATNPAEKKKILEKCLTLGKKAQKKFKTIGDQLTYGKTCNMLAIWACDLHCITTTSAGKIRVIQQGLSNATTAISVFSKLRNKDDLIVSLCISSILCVSLSEVNAQEKNKNLCNISLKYAKEAVELSEEVDNPYSKAMAFWAEANYTTWFEEKIEKRKSLEYPEEMLKQASIVRDNYLKGIAYHHLAYALYADVQGEADPDVKKQKFIDIIEYSKSAERCFRPTCRDSENATTHLFHSESYLFLAKEFAVTPSEKLAVLKKAIAAGEEGLEYAIQSGSPYALQTNLIALRRAYCFYSVLEPIRESRNRLLKRALKYSKDEIASTKKSFPSNSWYMGVGMLETAQIEAELARLQRNRSNKTCLFKDAISHMEHGVSKCKETLEFADVPAVRVRIANYEDILGGMLEEHFCLTGKIENLEKANSIYEDAAENFRKIALPSRAAESFWKIARNHDRIGDYRKAAESFEKAYVEYELAALKIPQASDFYLDYSTYVKAWSEIEKAKLGHSHEEYAVANQQYESLLEKAEDLSRKENCKESIGAFEEAIKFFGQSKRLLSVKLDGIQEADEKNLTRRLIAVSDAREQYSLGRIAVEEAKILDKQGDHATSSEKYGTAAAIFQTLLRATSEQIGSEAKPLFYLCKAWKKLTMAEARVSSPMYEEAADLFKLANAHALSESSSLLALAHSNFCKAMGAGTKFESTRTMSAYTDAKKYLNSAATYYLKAGFEAFSEYAKATHRLFDAYFYMDTAKRETDPDKEAKYYLMAEKVLEISGESYGRASYTEKAHQVQRLLGKVREERELALSLNDVLHAPAVTSSTASFGTLSLIEEKAVGLERFAHADVQAKLVKQEDKIKVGEYISLKIQIVNVGKEQVLLTKIENIAPAGFQLIGKPDYCSAEDDSLIFGGRQLGPLKTDEINIVLRPFKRGSFVMKPRITFVDETGGHSFYDPEGLELRVLESVLSGRLSTGFSDLDDLLLGGIPENYAVVLSSPSNDEREMIITKFLEAGAKSGQLTFYVTSNPHGAKALAEEFRSNFYLLVCGQTADVVVENAPNIVKLNTVENLTEINISLLKAFRRINSSKVEPKRVCLEILSDVLLQHHAVITRKWLNALLPDLKSRGFTTLAIVNRQMHPQEEIEAVLSQFEGEIQVFERETKRGLEQILRIRKLHNQRYLENEAILSKELKS